MINDIKAKLPLKKKAKDDEELDDNEDSGTDPGDKTDPSMSMDKTGSTEINDVDEEELEDRPQSLVDKIKAKLIPKKKAAKAEEDEEEDEETGKKKAPKKKINPVVLVVVLAGLGVFLFLDEEKPATDVAVDPAATLKKPGYKKKPKPETPAATDTAKTETPTTETPAATDTAATDTPVATDTPATTDTTEPAVTDMPSTTEEPTVDIPTDITSTEPAVEPTTTEEPAVTDTPSTEGPVSVDTVDGQVTADDSSMTDKILEDLEKQVKKDQPKELKKEYVSPPDYEYRGRGLVYNCAGKHWACIDAPSYKVCEDNFSSSTYQKKPIECYPFNVYDTTKGCELMQNRVVSSNAKTKFCSGN